MLIMAETIHYRPGAMPQGPHRVRHRCTMLFIYLAGLELFPHALQAYYYFDGGAVSDRSV